MSACHDRAGELLPDYVHGLLDPEEMARIEGHLKKCLECASEVQVIRSLEDETLPEPGPWFWTGLPGKVTAEVEARRRKKNRVLIPVWAGGLAAAAVAVLMFLQIGPVTQPQTDFPDYSAAGTADSVPLGIEEEFLSVSGLLIDDLDQTFALDLNAASEELMASRDLVPEGDGYETMDEETIRVFEDLVDKMTPEGSERG